nr:hypothetical protein [uncultured archaeon]
MGRDLKTVSTKVPPGLYRKIEEEVESGSYVNTSDFLREAIRETLEESEGQ